MFLLLVIYCCNKASNRIVTKQKDLVLFSWITLSPEVSRLSPYTHAQQHTQSSRTFYIVAIRLAGILLHGREVQKSEKSGEQMINGTQKSTPSETTRNQAILV